MDVISRNGHPENGFPVELVTESILVQADHDPEAAIGTCAAALVHENEQTVLAGARALPILIEKDTRACAPLLADLVRHESFTELTPEQVTELNRLAAGLLEQVEWMADADTRAYYRETVGAVPDGGPFTRALV